MNKLIMAISMVVFALWPASVLAQEVVELPGDHYLAQVLALPDWESSIRITNASDQADRPITIEFYGQDGTAASIATSLGYGSSFSVVPKPNEVKEILISRTSNGFVGWAKITSVLQLGVSLTLRQYHPGTDSVAARAEILESSPQHAFMVALDPNFGLALANPTRNTAPVTVTARRSNGEQIRAVVLSLGPGAHVAKYFKEAPFSFGNEKGTVVVSSNIPIIAAAFGFEGLIFSTVPIQASPRRAEIQGPGLVGTFYFVPAGATGQPNIIARTKAALDGVQSFISKELPRNGFPSKQFQIARSADGQPIVITVPGQKKREDYLRRLPNGMWDTVLGEINTEVALYIPPGWAHKMVFIELSKIVNGQFIDLPFYYGRASLEDSTGWGAKA